MLPPDFAPPPPPLRRAALPCFAPPLLAPLFFAPLFEPPLLLELRELPEDLELLPREALLDRELLLEPPRDALLPFEPLDFALEREALAFDELPLLLFEPPRDAPALEPPLALPPERAALLRFADDADDFEPRDDEADLLLLDEALPFEDDALFFEPLLLLEPPLALPPLRPAAAFFADVELELFELDPFDDEPLFFELPPLLFFDDDDADFLEAMWFSFS